MSAVPLTRPRVLRSWLVWMVSFLSFPLGGVVAQAAVGRVDGPVAALIAGLLTGAVIGIGQSVLSRGRLNVLRWTVASAVGMGGGLLLGAAVVDYGTSLRDLVLMGALTGVVLGAAQAIVLPVARVAWRVLWPLIVAGLWALGWTLTTLGGIDVDQQWSVVGSFGAITVTALMGLVLALTSTDRGNSFRP